MEDSRKIDKKIIKRIFREHWGTFKIIYPGYNTEYYDEVINKMLLCGEKEGGYATYYTATLTDEKEFVEKND